MCSFCIQLGKVELFVELLHVFNHCSGQVCGRNPSQTMAAIGVLNMVAVHVGDKCHLIYLIA